MSKPAREVESKALRLPRRERARLAQRLISSLDPEMDADVEKVYEEGPLYASVRSVEFHPDAQDEFISAAQFYERETEGLGLDFIATVQHAYARLPEFPASGAPLGRRLRRLLIPKFP